MILALVALPGQAPAQADSKDGWAAYDAGHYAEAVRLWTFEAEAGDREAQFGLGIAYDLGHGVPSDPPVACAWYERAGAAGLPSAAFNTAIMYDSGRCGPRRTDTAALWYARAAAAGHARAQFDLAQLYDAGVGVPRNRDVAAAWFRLAEANGIPAAAGRGRTTPFHGPGTMPEPAVPSRTDDLRPTQGRQTVLVWTAPQEPAGARFYLEMAALHPTGTKPLFSGYVDTTALQVSLPEGERWLAWRVLTITANPARYVASPWVRLDAQP